MAEGKGLCFILNIPKGPETRSGTCSPWSDISNTQRQYAEATSPSVSLEASHQACSHPPVHVPIGGERLAAHRALVRPLARMHQHVAVQGAGRAQGLPADAARVVCPSSVRVMLQKATITMSLKKMGPNPAIMKCKFRALHKTSKAS